MNRLILISSLLLFVSTLNSCKKKIKGCMDPASSNYNAKATEDDGSCKPAPKTIGQSFGGGLIAYVDSTGQHGLIAAPSDQSINIQWNKGVSQVTNATGISLGSGQSNTTSILNTQGPGIYAAYICDDLVIGSFSDWYLPSKDELELMYKNLKVSGLGGFANAIYWSSTEVDIDVAWDIAFNSGLKTKDPKSATFHVRAARTF